MVEAAVSETADVLAQSLAEHRAAMPQKPSGKRPGDWQDHMREAWRLRLQAHLVLDPWHADPAWEQEQYLTPRGRDTNEAMLAFYREKLG